MRAKEFINEHIVGKLSKRHQQATQAVIKMRDIGGYDRTNWLNRAMMAAACADGKDTKKLNMDSYSWAEKYNTAHPYTEAEWNMIMQVIATMPTDSETLVPWSKSMEPKSTNTKSIVSPFKGFEK